MSDHLEQRIVAICDFSEQMKDVIVHGARMADILKKELCLLSLWKDKNQKSEVQGKIEMVTRKLKASLPGLQISSLLIQGSLTNQIGNLVERYNAVLVVLPPNDIGYALKALRQSSVPFLFVKGSLPEHLQYREVVVPVDFRKASKEASLWASYFGRFNKSLVQVIFSRETDKDQAIRLTKNVDFFKKFLAGMNVRHHLLAGKSSSWGIWNEALEKAKQLDGAVLIFSGSSSFSLIDLLIGHPEKKIIRNAGDLPVLLINPRKDICVLCD